MDRLKKYRHHIWLWKVGPLNTLSTKNNTAGGPFRMNGFSAMQSTNERERNFDGS